MQVYLTEQSADIVLNEKEVQDLVEGKEVIGNPDTEFLSPFGKRIVIIRKGERCTHERKVQGLRP